MRVDLVAIAAVHLAIQRSDVYDLSFRKDLSSVLLSQKQVVLVECVLGIVPAAHHAAAAAHATASLRAFTAEVRIGIGFARDLALWSEEGTNIGCVKGVGDAI
ncbi:hypothetical protein D3C84_307620 [compost metagenome]